MEPFISGVRPQHQHLFAPRCKTRLLHRTGLCEVSRAYGMTEFSCKQLS